MTGQLCAENVVGNRPRDVTSSKARDDSRLVQTGVAASKVSPPLLFHSGAADSVGLI